MLQDRVRAGVDIRVIGRLEKRLDRIETRKHPGLRLHVRAMVRDGRAAFVGSQSLRRLELDGRREVGVILTDSRVARRIQAVFEADWTRAGGDAKPAEKGRPKGPLTAKPVAAAAS